MGALIIAWGMVGPDQDGLPVRALSNKPDRSDQPRHTWDLKCLKRMEESCLIINSLVERRRAKGPRLARSIFIFL